MRLVSVSQYKRYRVFCRSAALKCVLLSQRSDCCRRQLGSAPAAAARIFPLLDVESSRLVHRMRDRDYPPRPSSGRHGIPPNLVGLLAVIVAVGLLILWNNHRGRSSRGPAFQSDAAHFGPCLPTRASAGRCGVSGARPTPQRRASRTSARRQTCFSGSPRRRARPR